MKRVDLNALQGINAGDESVALAQATNGGAAQAISAPAQQPAAAQARSRGSGCIPGAIRILFGLAIGVVLTTAVLGLMGYRVPLIHEAAKTIGWTIITALNNSTARLGYTAIVVPAVLVIATWITAKARMK